MDSIQEILLLFGALMILAILMFYIVPSSTSISSEFQSAAVSQIILNSFNLVSSQINASVNYASIYDNGFPTTLYVSTTEYNASNNQPEITSSNTIPFVSGLNKISLPSSASNVYYEIELYNPSGDVLYTTYYVYRYVNDYIQINNILGNTKIFVNSKEVNLNTVNNSAILSLPPGIYNITIFTPFYYYSNTITFPLSVPLSLIIPTQKQYSPYTVYVDQMLPGNKLNPLPNAVLSFNDETATYKTGSFGNVSLQYITGGSVEVSISCPPSTCGTSITNNYTELNGTYTTSSFSQSTPFVLYPKFRVTVNLSLTCDGKSYSSPGSVSIIATPANITRNKYGLVNASGKFISYLYAGIYNVSGISSSGLFNSTQINVNQYNQSFSLSFPYCVTHIPYNETIFEESGLPSNTLWNVTYGGAINQSRTNKILFTEINTQVNYTYSIPTITVNGIKYAPIPSSGASPTSKIINVKFVNTIPILTISPNPAITSQSVTITATCAVSTDQCAIYYPNLNTQLASGIGTVTYTYPAGSFSAGSYSGFYAIDKNSNENSTPQTLTVKQNLPNGIQYYAPITIKNSQSSPTPSPFQQMINITESSYSNYIAYNNNFANFEYFDGNGTIIPSWIESNSSGKLVTWVKTISIPASSNVIIYLGFASKTTNLLSSSGTSGIGEAPQLSPTYAEYDDGASVFNFYDNFAGTTLSSKWTTSASGTIGIAVDNGITLTEEGTTQGYIESTSSFNNEVLGFYGKMYLNGGTSTTYCSAYFGYGNSSQYSKAALTASACPSSSQAFAIGGTNVGSITTDTSNTIWEIAHSSTSSTSTLYNNYINIDSGTDTQAYPYLLQFFVQANSGWAFYTQWARVRAYPPNGVMPVPTFGSVS